MRPARAETSAETRLQNPLQLPGPWPGGSRRHRVAEHGNLRGNATSETASTSRPVTWRQSASSCRRARKPPRKRDFRNRFNFQARDLAAAGVIVPQSTETSAETRLQNPLELPGSWPGGSRRHRVADQPV